MPVPPRIDPIAVGNLVGAAAFRRAQGYQRAGMVDSWRWDPDGLVLTARVAGSGARPYTARVWFEVLQGRYHVESSTCSCPVGFDCKHVAATLLQVGPAGVAGPGEHPGPGGWRGSIAAVTGRPTAEPPSGGVLRLGLRFRLDGVLGNEPAELSVRPVVPARTRGWKTAPEATWEALTRGLYAFADLRQTPAPPVRRWFGDLGRALSTPAVLGRSTGQWRPLSLGGRGLWTLLAEARDLDIPFVAGGGRDEVHLATETVLRVEAGAALGGVTLRTVATFDGDDASERAEIGTVGDTGLYSAETSEGRTVLRLGPTRGRLGDGVRELIAGGALHVPSADVDELYTEHLPALRRAVAVVSDGTLDLPPAARPVLVADATFTSPERAELAWTWRYPLADGSERTCPLDGAAHDASRDLDAEAEILAKAQQTVRGVAGFERFELAPRRTLAGLDALDLAHAVLPALDAVADIRLEATDVPDYLHLDAAPRVVVDGAASGDADWLDLGISVTVAGKELPFAKLFTALAKGQKRLLLVDGSWMRLDQPVLGRLRALIDEATALSDRPGELRVSRYDTGLWSDLEEVADVVDTAEDWRRSVAELRALTAGEATVAPLVAPAGLHATLRGYQHQGFEWLAFLWRHRLGGILADDMGLGKTIETLAFLAHAREQQPDAPPFLVVAPASVVGNWADEAARFTPDLRVEVLGATAKKLGRTVAEVAAGADLVVTSYAVHRLEATAFEQATWSGLILDEAQFAKNPRTRAHQVARRTPAPFKLAITGTPLENNLVDLWAMLAVVAPGLYPSLPRFRAEVVRPVEAAATDDDPAVVAAANRVLARLTRRVRAVMLRRTKEQVAPELPDRIEQTLRVPLGAEHRRIYDTHLQRERQRLLGLLEDFEANRVAIFRSLTTLRRLALDASLVDDAHHAVASAKLDVVVDQLTEVAAEGHRALVFSQFTSFLGRVKERCAAAGLDAVYLDGSTRRRAEVVRRFREGEAPVFLISLKAGGFGLNLTEADHVFLLDPWWNPAAENQAIDRTHRIGQTRTVQVTRLVAADTIEEKVLALARRKAALFDAVLDDETGAFAGALAAEDVRGLLAGDA